MEESKTHRHMTPALRRNEDLIPLIKQALDFHKAGDVRASAVRAKINIRLKKRGYDPKTFWGDFIKAGEIISRSL